LIKKIFSIPWDVLIKVQEILLVLTSLCIALSLNLVVILRYVFHADLFGFEEIVVMIAMWLYFLGGAYGSYEKSHIRAGLVTLICKNESILKKVDFVQTIITTILFIIISYIAVDFLQFSIMAGSKTSLHQVPYAVGHASVTIGFILMAFYSFVYLIMDIKKIITKT
jgi:TRAP-type C4-dicarboxylate transport system permease small subunit